jgi:hypothetical protein
MRKEFNVRIRLPESQGHEIHAISLKDNRSQSATVSLLVSEALAARRAEKAQVAEVARLATLLRTPSDAA